ncbi:NAD-dependent epimerase/dehydratase family protein [Actinomadura sp. SCN-SB]|uniref:NAD-dependent epimerase/dehydratase family protein n=1 Tax=Actinomadura sp. SCN-SB TaxID=3373092 RepID=UPI003750A609
MTILVLGGSGLVGRKLTRRLLDEGHSVVACDVAAPAEAVRGETEGAVHVRADISRLDQVLGVVKEHGVTRIALLSYIMGPLMSPDHAEILRAIEVNVTGVTNVLEAARLADARRVLFLSTVGTYGPPSLYGDRPVNEDDILAPQSMYGRMKALNESVADRYASLYGLEVVKVRPSAILGPGSTIWPARLLERVAVGEPGVVPYAPQARDNIIAAEDLAVLLSRLLTGERPKHGTYLGAAHNITMSELVQVTTELMPGARFEHPNPDRRPTYPGVFDNARAVGEFDWKPRGVRETVLAHIDDVRRDAGLAPLAPPKP